MFASKVYLFAALPLLVQAGLGMASPAPRSNKSVGKRLFDATFEATITATLDYSDSKFYTGEGCNYKTDIIRCVGGDAPETAHAQICVDAKGDDAAYQWWNIPQKYWDCGVLKEEKYEDWDSDEQKIDD